LGRYRLVALQAIWTNRFGALAYNWIPPEKDLMASSKQRGFSLLELSITLAIGLTIAGIAFVSLQPTLARARMDSGYDTAMMVLRDTRHLAVTQSHEYLVLFDPGGFPPGTLLVQYQPRRSHLQLEALPGQHELYTRKHEPFRFRTSYCRRNALSTTCSQCSLRMPSKSCAPRFCSA